MNKITVLKMIYDELRKAGLKVYFPSQHKGECEEVFVIVQKDETNKEQNISSQRPAYNIICVVPFNNYTQIETITDLVEQTMKHLYPMVSYTGNISPPIYDDDLKAYVFWLQYLGIKRVTTFS